MGNVNERDGSGSEDFEDGEIVYDTLARDFAYKKCNRIEGETKPLRRTGSTRTSRRPAARSTSRAGKSVKRSPSRRKAGKKNNDFLLSEMEVKVNGKNALLVPRISVLQKRGLASMLRARLTIPKRKKTTKKTKLKKSKKSRSMEYLSVAPPNFAKRPSYDAAMSSDANRVENIYSILPLNLAQKETKKHTLADVFADKPSTPRPRSKSTHANTNNNNISKTGNMARNIEKDRLRKIKSHDITSDISSHLSRLSIDLVTEL